ncbi:MAG: hypothetical protein ABFD76_15420 [Smithella sp.]
MLSENRRVQLDGIVNQMISNKESDDNIQFVVNDFKTKYDVAPIQPTPKEKPGFLGKINESLVKRGVNIADELTPQGNESFGRTLLKAPERALRTTGQAAGLSGDVIGHGIGSIVDTITPESVQTAVKSGVKDILNTSLGKQGLEAAKAGYDTYQGFKTQYPNVAKDLEATVNIATILPMGKAGQIGAKTAKEGVNIAQDVGTVLTTKTPQAIDKKLSSVVQSGVDKAVRPSVAGKRTAPAMKTYYNKAKDAVKTIIDNKEGLVLTDADGNAVKGLPRTLKQFSEAIDQTKKSIYQKYHGMATEAGEQGSLFDTSTIMTKLDDVAGDLKHNPQVRDYANNLKAEIAELHGQTPEIIEARIADLNSSLSGFYEGRVSRAKAQVDASVANLMREELDNKIMNAVGAGYKDLKKQYGALKTLEKEVAHRAIVDARKNSKGLFDLTDVFTNGEIAAGILTMNPAMLTRGVIGKISKESLKFWNNPNRIVKGMFKDADNLISKSARPELRSKTGRAIIGSLKGVEDVLSKEAPGAIRYPGRPDLSAGVPSADVRSGVTVGQPYGESIGRLVQPRQLPAGQGFELQGAPTGPDVIDAVFTSRTREVPRLNMPRREPTLALPNGQGFELVNNRNLGLAKSSDIGRIQPSGDTNVWLKEQLANLERESGKVGANQISKAQRDIADIIIPTLRKEGYNIKDKEALLKELEPLKKSTAKDKGTGNNIPAKETTTPEAGKININNNAGGRFEISHPQKREDNGFSVGMNEKMGGYRIDGKDSRGKYTTEWAAWDHNGKLIKADKQVTPEKLEAWQRAIDKAKNSWVNGLPDNIYIRYGDLPKGSSIDYSTGKREKGLSVFNADKNFLNDSVAPNLSGALPAAAVMRAAEKSSVYLVKGRRVGTGTDGEPVIKRVEIIGRLRPHPDESVAGFVLEPNPNPSRSPMGKKKIKSEGI